MQLNIKHIRSVFKNSFMSILLVVFYLTEAINKYSILNDGVALNLTKAIKGLLLFFILYLIIKRKHWDFLKLLLFLILSFIIGQLSIAPNFESEILINVVKYLFLPLLLFYFNKLNNDKLQSILTLSLFEKIILLNSALIFVGFAFKINMLETYKGTRFGYSGLLVSSATSTYFYIIAIMHLFLKHKKNFLKSPLVIFSLLATTLVGTKSLYLFIFVIFIIFIFYFLSKKIRIYVFLALTSLMVLWFYYTFYELNRFSDIREKEGMLTSILSFRDQIIINETLPFIKSNWNFSNYLFGGINDISTRPQMSIIDLIYFFGFFGSFIYLKIFSKAFFNFRLKQLNILFILFVVFISILAGNFFINATIPIYVLILRESINKELSEKLDQGT